MIDTAKVNPDFKYEIRTTPSYELYVIAAAVIGGANLMGGHGSIFGAFVGAALIFLIRNSLIMFGIDANWYDMFVGLFIILAVLLERIRAGVRG
jgi:ribose transport system permease protein